MRQSLKTLYRRKKGLSWVTVEGGGVTSLELLPDS